MFPIFLGLARTSAVILQKKILETDRLGYWASVLMARRAEPLLGRDLCLASYIPVEPIIFQRQARNAPVLLLLLLLLADWLSLPSLHKGSCQRARKNETFFSSFFMFVIS